MGPAGSAELLSYAMSRMWGPGACIGRGFSWPRRDRTGGHQALSNARGFDVFERPRDMNLDLVGGCSRGVRLRGVTGGDEGISVSRSHGDSGVNVMNSKTGGDEPG